MFFFWKCFKILKEGQKIVLVKILEIGQNFWNWPKFWRAIIFLKILQNFENKIILTILTILKRASFYEQDFPQKIRPSFTNDERTIFLPSARHFQMTCKLGVDKRCLPRAENTFLRWTMWKILGPDPRKDALFLLSHLSNKGWNTWKQTGHFIHIHKVQAPPQC